MGKRFFLIPYRYYYDAWRGLAAVLFILCGLLLIIDPEGIRDYRPILLLSAGLGLIVIAWGYGMSHLSFVAVGKKGVVVQLPFWRVRVPFTAIRNTRLVSLDKIAPNRFKEVELAELAAVMIDLDKWPQPQSLMSFWLGRLVLPDGILLPVDDVIGLRRKVDANLQELKETARQPIPVRSY